MVKKSKGCKNCQYFEEADEISDNEVHYGWCTRFPPQVISNSEILGQAIFPMVKSDSLCGEYKK